MSDVYEYGRGSIWVGYGTLVIECDNEEYSGVLSPEKARKLAYEILVKWPLSSFDPKPDPPQAGAPEAFRGAGVETVSRRLLRELAKSDANAWSTSSATGRAKPAGSLPRTCNRCGCRLLEDCGDCAVCTTREPETRDPKADLS